MRLYARGHRRQRVQIGGAQAEARALIGRHRLGARASAVGHNTRFFCAKRARAHRAVGREHKGVGCDAAADHRFAQAIAGADQDFVGAARDRVGGEHHARDLGRSHTLHHHG